MSYSVVRVELTDVKPSPKWGFWPRQNLNFFPPPHPYHMSFCTQDMLVKNKYIKLMCTYQEVSVKDSLT